MQSSVKKKAILQLAVDQNAAKSTIQILPRCKDSSKAAPPGEWNQSATAVQPKSLTTVDTLTHGSEEPLDILMTGSSQMTRTSTAMPGSSTNIQGIPAARPDSDQLGLTANVQSPGSLAAVCEHFAVILRPDDVRPNQATIKAQDLVTDDPCMEVAKALGASKAVQEDVEEEAKCLASERPTWQTSLAAKFPKSRSMDCMSLGVAGWWEMGQIAAIQGNPHCSFNNPNMGLAQGAEFQASHHSVTRRQTTEATCIAVHEPATVEETSKIKASVKNTEGYCCRPELPCVSEMHILW